MKFNQNRFGRIAADFERWWQHELERPIIQVSLSDMTSPHNRRSMLNACYDMNISMPDVMQEIEATYDATTYYGDAFPLFYMRSTGILGVFMGQSFIRDAEAGVIHYETVPNESIDDLRFEFDTENPIFLRTKAIMESFQKHFGGSAALGVPDLGGVLDILSAFRGAQELMFDMFDCPDKVKAASWQIHEEFKKAYEIHENLIDAAVNPGYTAWATMLSKKPYYITQCDFSFMIGTDMFDAFYKPILIKESELVERTFYHLDGPGQVKHLDSILEVENLDGVQWINGAGAPGLDQWPDIYKKIQAAKKLTQVFVFNKDELKYIDAIVDQVGTTKGLCFICFGDINDEEDYLRYLEKYQIPLS